VTIWVWDNENLVNFLKDLASDFRGWTGERAWRNNHLTRQAIFRLGGHVELTWTLQAWDSHQASWEASITTWIEAGEQMSARAADIHAFLTST
jgi:hypothetical protein